jgi:FkbM family methyltransferase
MRRVGALSALRYDFQRARRALRMAPPVVTLTARRSRHVLYARPQSSDFTVFGQTFITQPYACLDDLSHVDFIVDAGANVGFASAFLLTQFPGAELLAIEPDAGNFDILRRNLAPYGPRARAVLAGLWSHRTQLRVEETPYRDGGAWAIQVRESAPGEASQFDAIDVPGVLAQTGRQRISILKMDIEGAECVVFSAPNAGTWLAAVDCILIELHDDTHFGTCSDVFQRAIEDQGFVVSHAGELTMCRRPRTG